MTKNSRSNFSKKALIPTPLARGDTIGIVSTSGPVDNTVLEKGIQVLEDMDFKVIQGNYVNERNNYLAGTDQQRCDDLNSMLRNPEIRGILLARGGYGCMRILPFLDYQAARVDPKPIIGMSDATALQLAFHVRCGLVTFSGPMVAAHIGQGLDQFSKEWFLQTLMHPLEDANFFPVEVPVAVLRSGRARGPLVGGCLSLITALAGTPFFPDLRGAILFIEDVNEPVYRVDRMLTQLRLGGVLDKISALIIGYFAAPDGSDISLEVEQIALEFTQHTGIPLISRFPHGHNIPNMTLPHGLPVRMETSFKSILMDKDASF